MANALPLFHLYGDPPDDQAFDFIHVETISSRSSMHDWTIRAHRHRNLFQILLIERGGGEMTYEAATLPFAAPAAILVPADDRARLPLPRRGTEGWVVSFTEDVADALGRSLGRGAGAAARAGRASDRAARRRGRARSALGAVRGTASRKRILAREGYRLAMRGLLALIAVARGAACGEPRAHRQRDACAGRRDGRRSLRTLVEENFRKRAAARLLCRKARA